MIPVCSRGLLAEKCSISRPRFFRLQMPASALYWAMQNQCCILSTTPYKEKTLMLSLKVTRIPLRMPVLYVLLAGLLAGLFLSGAVSLAQEDEHGEGDKPIHWTYEGEAGPDHWGDLSPDFALCSTGLAESPIDITGTTALNLSDIAFDYTETAIRIFN